MQIRIITNDTVVMVTLFDSETARDFVSLLPLTLTLEEYAGIEKSAICLGSYRHKMRLLPVTLPLEISPTIPLGKCGNPS